MKKVQKHLDGIIKIKDYNDKYFVVYNEKNMLSFVTKDTLEFVHADCWFRSYRNYDDSFILVENMSGLYALLRKDNLAFLKKGAWYKSWFNFSNNLFRVQRDDELFTLIKKSDGNYLFEDEWFSEITNFNQDYYKGYDKDKKCFLISKKSSEIITGVEIKYSDIFFDSGNYFLDTNELICPARIYNKAIKPLKNDLWANDYTHIEDDFYLAFDGVKYNVINLKTGKFVFCSLYKHEQIKIRRFDENYWLLSFPLYGKYTLINKPKYDDENIELSFPIMINGKPLFFYDYQSFNYPDVILLKDKNFYHLFRLHSFGKLSSEELLSDIKIKSVFYFNDKIDIISNENDMYNVIRKSDCKLLFNEWFKGVTLYKNIEMVILKQDINDKCTIISDCGNILLKDINVSDINQVILSKKGVIIYDGNSNLTKINFN